jgi:hypothetical protein
MAIFELEIADGDVQRVFDAICQNYGWKESVPNPSYTSDNGESKTIENPENKGDFTHRMVRGFLSEHVKAYEVNKARDEAAANINTEVVISDPQP